MTTRHNILILALLTFFGLTSCSSPQRELPKLSYGLEPLRTAFNQDAGAVRLLLLVDPT